MMFSTEELLKFKNLCQQIIEKPRPMDDQKFFYSQDGFLYCQDWHLIEILKYFFNGREGYIGDPPPRRLKGNPFFSKEAVMKEAEDLLAIAGGVDELLDLLKEMRAQKGETVA